MLRRPVESAQYVSIRYSERLAEAGVEPSVGSKGDSYDNALAETINGLYKAELIHQRAPWRTKEAVELATLEWVSWFNHQRLLEPVGYIPPAEAEANYYRQLSGQSTAVEARLNPTGLRDTRGGSPSPGRRRSPDDYAGEPVGTNFWDESGETGGLEGATA